jgi:hypothetical protein
VGVIDEDEQHALPGGSREECQRRCADREAVCGTRRPERERTSHELLLRLGQLV